jgi:DNA-binding CsgD family transcriptional regulator
MPMGIVDRDTELSVFDEIFASVNRGQGAVLLISGSAACGKTALARACEQRAAHSGAKVLGGRARRLDSALPFGTLGALFDPAALPAPLPDRARRLLSGAAVSLTLHEPDSETADQILWMVQHGLGGVLSEAAEHGPLLISVDDLQHADEVSLQSLLYLARWLAPYRIALLLTETLSPQAHPQFYAALRRLTHCRRLVLGPLSVGGVRRLLTGRFDEAGACALAPRAYEATGGNALLVKALIEDTLLGEPGPPARPVLGEAFGRAVRSCLLRGDPGVHRVAQALAVLDGPSDPQTIAAMLDLSAESAARAVDALGAIGVLTEGGFRDGAMREAILEGLAAEARGQLHTLAAAALHGLGASAQAQARHLVRANHNEAQWAVPVLQEAAKQAMAEDDAGGAIECLRLAYHLCASTGPRGAIHMALNRAVWRIDPSAVAGRLSDFAATVAAELPGPGETAAAVGHLCWHGRPREAAELLDLAGAPWGGPEADPQLAAALLWLGCMFPAVLNPARRERAMALHAPAAPAAAQASLKAARVVTLLLTGRAEQADHAVAEQVLQGCRLGDDTLAPIAGSLLTLACVGRHASAGEWCDHFIEEAEQRAAPVWHAMLSALRSVISAFDGDLPAARRHGETALALITPRGWGVLLSLPLAALVSAATAQGRHTEAAIYLRAPMPEELLETPFGAYYLCARGRHHLAVGRYREALDDFDSCARLDRIGQVDLAGLVPWRLSAAEAQIGLGALERAKELLAVELDAARPGPSRARGVALRLRAALSAPARRPALLRDAADTLEACGEVLEQAIALNQLGLAHAALGEQRLALIVTRQAHELAAACGAEELERTTAEFAARQRPEAAPAPRRSSRAGCVEPAECCAGSANCCAGPAELSAAEFRVAVLASGGYTNRQIAERCEITVSTVEQHLTRAYRKYRVTRRSELAALRLGEDGSSAPEPAAEESLAGAARERKEAKPEPRAQSLARRRR